MLVYLGSVPDEAGDRVRNRHRAAVPLTLVAGTRYLLMGSVYLMLPGSLPARSIPGSLLTTRLGGWAPETALRAAIAIVLALVGLKLAFG